MSRTPASLWNHLVHAVVAGSIACLVLAPRANAGIGNPLKKAKEKLEQAAKPKDEAAQQAQPDGQVVFDDVTVPLTNERIEKILATYKKVGQVNAGRQALVEKMQKLHNEQNDIGEKHGQEIQVLRDKRAEVEGCYHEKYQAIQQRRAEEYAKRVLSGDPALIKKYSDAAQKDNAAAAQGDSAAQQRLQGMLHSEVLPTREDSMGVKAACGSPPPNSAAEKRLEAIEKENASLYDQLRGLDEKEAATMAESGSMNRAQWGMALERTRMYLAVAKSTKGKKSGAAPRGFSEEEQKALEAHLQELLDAGIQ